VSAVTLIAVESASFPLAVKQTLLKVPRHQIRFSLTIDCNRTRSLCSDARAQAASGSCPPAPPIDPLRVAKLPRGSFNQTKKAGTQLVPEAFISRLGWESSSCVSC
jgi:hypothetical protein